MQRINSFFIAVLMFYGSGQLNLYAQLDGSGNAPDFILTDIDSVDHHLYEYLDSGKVVLVDFFAVWCGICQSNTQVLENVYKKYGPDGSDKMVLLSLEADNSTTDQQVAEFADFYNADYPHINATLDTGEKYLIPGFPVYYVIAPDRSYHYFPGIEMNLEDSLSVAIETSPGLREVENDARISSFSEPRGTYCQSEVIPAIEVQNYGKNVISEFVLLLEMDGKQVYSHRVEQELQPYEYLQFSMPPLENLRHGWHEVNFSISSVNSGSDADSNNGNTSGYFLFLEESEEVEVHIKTDTYPAETFWRITEDGKTASERLSFNRARTLFKDKVCLEPDHCYSLILSDRFGDGLSEGWVNVLYKGDTLASLSSDSINGHSSEINFCLKTRSAGTEKHFNDQFHVDVFPNPVSNQVYLLSHNNSDVPASVHILNSAGQILYEDHFVDLSAKKTINISAFPSGIFFLRIFKEEHIIIRKILIKK